MGLGPKQMGEAISRNMKDKTGKTVSEWVKVLKKKSIENKKEAIQFLKTQHQLGHFQATHVFKNLIGQKEYDGESKLIEQLFTSENLKKKYDEVAEFITSLGEDVKIQPCKTYVPFYKKHQFALLAPKDENELIIGINLSAEELQKRQGMNCKLGSKRINCQYNLLLDESLTDEIKTAIKTAYKNN